jgi:hypothetical protein
VLVVEVELVPEPELPLPPHAARLAATPASSAMRTVRLNK